MAFVRVADHRDNVVHGELLTEDGRLQKLIQTRTHGPREHSFDHSLAIVIREQYRFGAISLHLARASLVSGVHSTQAANMSSDTRRAISPGANQKLPGRDSLLPL